MSGLNERCELGPVLCKTRVSEFFEGRSRATGQRIVVQVTPMAADSREALERTLERAIKALTLSKMRGLAGKRPGSPPPEAGDYGGDATRSAVFSLGCVLSRLLAGAPPFVGADDNDTRQKHRAAPVPPVPGEPSGSAWNAVFAKLLAKRPEDRPQPEDIETLMRPLRYAGMPLGDLVKSEAGFRKPVEQPFPTKTAATIAVAVLVIGGIVLGVTQFGGAGSSVAGTTPSGTPSASARPSGAGSGAPSAPAAASPAASADPATQAPVGTPGPATRPPTPRPTVAPTPPPPTPPPTPPPDSVSPVAGRVGTTFHLVFVGLGGGDIYRTSYTRGNLT